ncbi:MAG: response regulator transcription factor [Cyanobacteriota bacterium]|jgi:DNA-binding NarL/FixJ family response regulator
MGCVPNPVVLQSDSTLEPTIRISPAERRVLTLLLRGHGNGAIACSLNLSRRTVEGHVSALLRKTGCHSRTQLVLWALAQG